MAADARRFGVSQRLEDCGARPVASQVTVRLTASGTAFLSGLASCGLVHQCPWCSAKIRALRTAEILEAVAACEGMGGSVHLLTLTLPHDLTDSLRRLLAGLHGGWSRIPRGGAWTRLARRIGYLGYYYAEECTYRCAEAGAGWHPHVHVLIFTAAPLDAEGMAALSLHARRQWRAGVVAAGLRCPDIRYGVDLVPNAGGGQVGRYIAKVQETSSPTWTVGHELARGDVKDGLPGSQTPFMLAAEFTSTGDLETLALWREYVTATKGRPAIRSSRGLRAKLGLAAAATDEALAAAEVEAESDVAVLSCPVWSRVLAARIETDLLAAAERGGLAAINELLAVHGCGWANAPPLRE
jgi:hypothetical protein